MAIDLSKVTSVVTRPVGDGGGPVPVQLSGSSVDLRGLHINRPDADAVEPGTTYWSVDESSAPGTVYVSDGSAWTVVAVL